MPSFNQHMLADMLARLSNTIADKSDEIRGFALEIILTLTDVVKFMDHAQLEQFPQMFWAAVACLYSPYEAEHAEALVLLEIVLEKYGFSNELASSFPKNWASEFEGLQPLLLKGLQFESAEEKTFTILSSIMLVDNPPLIDPSETRLLYLFLGSLCRLLHGLDVGSDTDEHASAVQLSTELTQLFEWYALPNVQRILATYPKQKSKFQEDYLKQLLVSIRDVFFPKYANQALMFALLLVKNKIPYYREKGLILIENLVPYVKKTQPSLSNTTVGTSAAHGEIPIDIASLSPLLHLVQTDFADKALSILNAGIPAAPAPIPAAPSIKDNDGASDPNITTTTATTATATAANVIWGFGPASMNIASQIARHNVHAVVFECSSLTNQAPIEHNIQFSIEDFSLLTGENDGNATARMFGEDEVPGTESMMSSTSSDSANAAIPGEHGAVASSTVPTDTKQPMDGSYGEDLMNALKDLDDFFNEDVDTPLSPSSNSSYNRDRHEYSSSNGPGDFTSSGIGFDSDVEI